MKVQIENNLYLESDSMQFIVKEYTGNFTTDKKTGKEIEQYKTHGYFPSVVYALNHVVKMKVMESTAQTLGELQEDIRRFREYIDSTFYMNVSISRTEGVDNTLTEG